MRPLPAQPQRIILLNPTRFLGNLLIAGGLIQDFAAQCRAQGLQFRLVLDAAFAGLVQEAFAPDELLLYPRRELAHAAWPAKLALYLRCLHGIRDFRADLAFNIEDDSVAHRLTQLSGADYTLGCSPQRHKYGYDQVLPVQFTRRAAGEAHRWYSFQEVFLALGLPRSQPHYLQLKPAPLSAALRSRLQHCGVDLARRLAVLHPGATKTYKLWPDAHFTALAQSLVARDYQVVLMGAGHDAVHVDAILAQLPETLHGQVVSVCNQLSLAELASFLPQAALMVGNDSGPFHMAAALGVRSIVIFGPTEAKLWGPIAPQASLLQDRSVCLPGCSRHHCRQDYRCLAAISPGQVLHALDQRP